MIYADLIARLYSISVFRSSKYGLENILALCRHLGNPHKYLPAIHIAGTNGKGSCATKIAAALSSNGYKVGLYTSPHISSIRERIQICGLKIQEQQLGCCLQEVFHAMDCHAIPATFFELITAVAFMYFAREKVDFAVLETGLGGRLDATNICNPLLTVITSISLDHTEILGYSFEDICQEKAGILKPQIPVVIGPHVPQEVVHCKAQKLNCELFQVDDCNSSFDEENRAIAELSLAILSKSVTLSPCSIQIGLNALPPCRFEIIPDKYLRRWIDRGLCPESVILDVAHNPDGILKLMEKAQKQYGNVLKYCLCGMSQSKDIQTCFKIMARYCSSLWCVQAENERALPCTKLYQIAQQCFLDTQQVYCYRSMEQALNQAMQRASEQKAILIVCGSFFIMKEVRQFFHYEDSLDTLDLNEKINRWASKEELIVEYC